MSEASSPSARLLESARTFGRQLVATLQDRVALVSVELHEEKLRLIQTFLWASLVIFTGIMALTFSTLVLITLFWDSARIALLVGCAVFYGIATTVLVVAFQRFLRGQPRPLAATLDELEADTKCIRPPN
jgi:uncharacterized membrane protein YqjE